MAVKRSPPPKNSVKKYTFLASSQELGRANLASRELGFRVWGLGFGVTENS